MHQTRHLLSFLFPAKFSVSIFREDFLELFFFRNLIKDDHGFHGDVLSSEALHLQA
jgi:hypothetical protein